MPVYVYSRAGSEGPECAAQDGLAAEAERLLVQTYALEQGWLVSQSFQDTGAEWNTPFHQRSRGAVLLSVLAAGDTLLSASLGHLCGSVAQLASLLERLKDIGVEVHIADLRLNLLSPSAEISFHAAARLFAELENRRSAERILSVKRRQREKGRFLGGSRPFGYSVHENGRLIENPTEQRTVEKIRTLRQKGQSLRAIASAVSTPIAPISFKTVQRVLQRLDAE